ncbi:potassium/proton antiporter [Oceanibacterium hippocampi]|uniref:K(+)/H(+) antiporter NhaP n=1 Tax=Oceanibacterium hippocampi TaxID=745714 RepID=A0A1Y5RAQ8_9PROT|nr:potassium/proton antiporter [Oceanibacterium hippocampi]SLN12672.1 K(+)/H(+) antiporter NhaP [Oceanibacterium hippocampi]
MEQVLLFVCLLIFMGFLLIPVSRKLGAPILLLVLLGGMLVGEDGPGQVRFDDFSAAYALGSIALAVILFAGGLETDIRKLRGARIPSLLLATLGVIGTAGIVGVAASFILDMPLEQGLLLGAVVGSTDAAATFLLIQQGRIGLPPRLQNTLVLESGLNDPMAIFLTIALTSLVNLGEGFSLGALGGFLPLLVLQIGLGTVAGLAGGWALTYLLDNLTLPDGLYPPMALAGALSLYALTAVMGGSGFLAIYLCGLVLAARLKTPIGRVRNFCEGLQWLSQIALFLMLGLLVTPSALVDMLPQALAVSVVLMLVARPLAVMTCVVPFRFPMREQLYLSWVGLRGAVPIFLAIVPVITPGPITVEFFNIVFVIVAASLVFQGWTVAPSARWLGIASKDGS